MRRFALFNDAGWSRYERVYFTTFSGSRRVTRAIREAELREKRRVVGRWLTVKERGKRESGEERQREQRRKEETQLSEVWVEGKSLTWSPKRSSLSFLGEVSLAVSCGITIMSSPSSDPSLTRN